MGVQPSVSTANSPLTAVRFTTGKSAQFSMYWARSSMLMPLAFRGWPLPTMKLWQLSGVPVSKMQSFSAMVDFWRFGPPLATLRA
jgi:hypothetical protein